MGCRQPLEELGSIMPDPSNEKQAGGSPDVRAIHHLVRLMHKYDLTSIDVAEGTTRIRLRRTLPGAPMMGGPLYPGSVPPPPVPSYPQGLPLTPVPPAYSAPETEAATSKAGLMIESPMVGTFYASSSPDAAPFVGIGSVIRSDTTVCIIEAMKVFTEIPAGISGRICEVLVKSGQAVEFGQPLFRVEPS